MNSLILKSLPLIAVAAIFSGCADDPVTTTQSTSTRRVVSPAPAPMTTTVVQPSVQSTTTTQY